MTISSIYSVSASLLDLNQFNGFLCANGYESRASYVAKCIENADVKKNCLAFESYNNAGSRPSNNEYFNRLNYNIYEVGGADSSGARSVFSNMIPPNTEQNTNLLIDISSMTRSWYGSFIRHLISLNLDSTIVTVFAYCPASYTDINTDYPPNEIVGPVSGFYGLGLPNKPTALVLGLGTDKGRALGVTQVLDPNVAITFQAKPGVDPRYDEDVVEANEELLALVHPDFQHSYPIMDPVDIYEKLESACSGLLREYHVVLTSVGPKIFSLCCFLLASHYPRMSVWRVTAGQRKKPVDRKANADGIDDIVLLAVEWE